MVEQSTLKSVKTNNEKRSKLYFIIRENNIETGLQNECQNVKYYRFNLCNLHIILLMQIKQTETNLVFQFEP